MAARALARARRFAAMTSFCLALGIGASTAMVTVVYRVFLQAPEGVREPATITRLYFERRLPAPGRMITELTSFLVFDEMRKATQTLSGLAAFRASTVSEGLGETATRLRLGLVSEGFFSVLGTKTLLGESIDSRALTATRDHDVAISSAQWRTRFGGRADVIGETLFIAGRHMRIIGVMESGFKGIEDEAVDAWLRLEAAPPELISPGFRTARGFATLALVGRLRKGVSRGQAATDASRTFRNAMRAISGFDSTDRVIAAPIGHERGPRQSGRSQVTLWLAGVSTAVLVIAIANAASLMLFRSLGRRTEIAVRAAVGARQSDLLRELLLEGLMIAALGAVGAVLVAAALTGLLKHLLLPSHLRADAVPVWQLLIAGVITALMVIGALSMVVARRTWRSDLTTLVRSGGQAGASITSRWRQTLVASQVALSVMLLVGTGLFAGSVLAVQVIDPGFEPAGVYVVNVDFPNVGGRVGPRGEPRTALFERLERELRSEPGVDAVAVSTSVPFQSTAPGLVRVPEGQADQAGYPMLVTVASREYARVLGLRVVAGRWFDDGDYRGLTRTAVVSQSAAAVIWGSRPALGQCLIVANGVCRSVIGVVADTRRTSLIADPRPEVYVGTVQEAATGGSLPRTLLVKANPSVTSEMLRRYLLRIEAALPYVGVQRLTDLMAPQLLPWRLGATAFAIFGALALLLTAIGVYGAVGAVVRARSREVGLRIALGARRHHVCLFVLGLSGKAVLIGIAMGLIGAVAVAPALRELLFGVSPRSIPILFAAASTVTVAALLASVPAAITAIRVDPADSLRQL
jgi:predicted permease